MQNWAVDHFRKRYSIVRRYHKIVKVLIKYSLEYVSFKFGLFLFLHRFRCKKNNLADQYIPVKKIPAILSELGTTFIKFGQILSTRHDLLSPDLIHELEKLQDEVPAFSFETAKKIIETELKSDLEGLYSFFDYKPLAAASIGQVYRAILIDGRQVVVKIRRPDINKEVEADLKILYKIARFLEKRISWAQKDTFVELVAEFERTIKEEMDFALEGRNASKFKRNFASDPGVLIPAVYWQFTTSKILTLEYLNGIKFNDLKEIERSGFSRMELALKLVQALFKQIMIDGFFHGDPHPGNVAVGPQGQIIFMDFGMVGRMNEESKIIAGDLFLALVGRDADRVAKAVLALGVVSENVDKNLLQRDIELLQEKYYTTSLDRISLKEAISDLMEVVFKYRVRLLPEFIMLAKSLMTLEGVVQELAPDLNIISMAEPFARKLVADRYLKKDLPEKARKALLDLSEIIYKFPKRIGQILEILAQGEIKIKLKVDHCYPDEKNSLSGTNIIINQFWMIVAVLLTGSVLLALNGTYVLGGFPVVKTGFIAAGSILVFLALTALRK